MKKQQVRLEAALNVMLNYSDGRLLNLTRWKQMVNENLNSKYQIRNNKILAHLLKKSATLVGDLALNRTYNGNTYYKVNQI